MKNITLGLLKCVSFAKPCEMTQENSMFTNTRVWRAALLLVGAIMLAGCGGSDVESGTNTLLTCEVPNVPNDSGTACVPVSGALK